MTMILAAVHLHPGAGVPIALLALLGLGLYMRGLDREGVPAPRRRVRRTATATMMVGVVALLVAISFADPVVAPTFYVASWSAVFLLLVGVVVLAVVDFAVSSWLIGLEHEGDAMRRGAAALAALEAEAARRAELRASAGHDADADADLDLDLDLDRDRDRDRDAADDGHERREPRP
jgi:hypothetical protein